MLSAFELWKLFIEEHLTLDVKIAFRLQKHHCENISQKRIKNESCKCYLGNNEQKTMFLAVSQSAAHFEASIFLSARSGMPENCAPEKSGT